MLVWSLAHTDNYPLWTVEAQRWAPGNAARNTANCLGWAHEFR
jgi:hypothetical protein